MPAGQRAIHWASWRQALGGTATCVAVVYEGRGLGIMANAGFDTISGGNINGDEFISRYVALDATSWRTIGGSSCTPTQLRAQPPPL